MWRQRWNATNRPTGRETDLQAIWARQSWQVCGTNCWCWQGNKAETHAARKFRLALDNIGRSQIWHLMRLTQRIFLLTERYWSRTPLTLYNCWKKKTTTKRQLLRERIGDLNTCLQWLGLSTELKTVSSLFFYGIRHTMAFMYVYIKHHLIWQLVLDGVVDMNVGYEANDVGSTYPSSVYLSYFILHSKVGLKLFFR